MLMVDEADPEAESVNLVRGCHPPRVAGLDLVPCAGPTAEVAHHLGIRVELDLPLEVLVGEWHQREPLGVQGLLGHRAESSMREPRRVCNPAASHFRFG
jgi:hypothetical protein